MQEGKSGQTEDSWSWTELSGGSPPPPLLGEAEEEDTEEEEGSGSISALLSSIVGTCSSSSSSSSSSARDMNSGWTMKLWMELLDSRLEYSELRKAFTTLIWGFQRNKFKKKERIREITLEWSVCVCVCGVGMYLE